MAYPKNIIPNLTLVQDKKSKIWNVSFTNPKNGYTYRRSTGERNKAEAQQAAHAMAAQLTGLTPKSADYKIGELLNAYKASNEEIGDTDERALKKLSEFFAAYKPDQLGDAAWKAYRIWRTSQDHAHAAAKHYKQPKKVGHTSVNRELNVFRAAIRWAQASPHWKGLQHVRVSTKGGRRNARVEFLLKEEAQRLLDACVEPHHELFVLVALATGARHRAILNLTWDRVTWPQGGKEPKYGDRELITKPISEVIPGATWHESIDTAVRFALLEIALNLGHLIGDVSEAEDRLATSLRERIEGRSFHLDSV